EVVVGGAGDLEGGVDGVEDVATEIAHGPAAEVLPVAPAPGGVASLPGIGPHRGDADPLVPVERLRHGIDRLRAADVPAAAMAWRSHPGMHLHDLADAAGLHQLRGGAVELVRVDLVAHAGDE